MWHLNGKLAALRIGRVGPSCGREHVQQLRGCPHMQSRNGAHTHKTTHPTEQSDNSTHLIILLIKPGTQKGQHHALCGQPHGKSQQCVCVQMNDMLPIGWSVSMSVHIHVFACVFHVLVCLCACVHLGVSERMNAIFHLLIKSCNFLISWYACVCSSVFAHMNIFYFYMLYCLSVCPLVKFSINLKCQFIQSTYFSLASSHACSFGVICVKIGLLDYSE